MKPYDHVIYLDYQATTPVDPRVLDAMLPYLTSDYGNPSSANAHGRRAADAVRRARQWLKDLIGARHDTEIVFTSGATEAGHLAIAGIAQALQRPNHQPGGHIVTTAIEHKAVLATCRQLRQRGYRITVVPVGGDGIVDPADIAAAIDPDTLLVSVMHANNEIGTVQPLAQISTITREHRVLLHTDAAQSLGVLPFNAARLGVDLASFSGHKIYGPKGVGALYVRQGSTRPISQLAGGDQEHGLRAGTLNVPGIAGLGAAAAILTRERDTDAERVRRLRDRLLMRLQEAIPDLRVNGSWTARLPGNLNIAIPGIDADQLVQQLSGLAISTGSACNTGQADPSHVLTAIGLDRSTARSSLRISIGRPTTTCDIDDAAEQLITEAGRARAAGLLTG